MRELQFINYGGLTRLGYFGLSLEEMFPEEAGEEQRLNGRFKRFKSVEEVPDDDVSDEGVECVDISDTDDIDPEIEYWDLIFMFGDGKHDEPALVNTIVQPEEKEKIDKKSVFANFTPFSKEKVKCQIHSRKHGKRGREKSFDIHLHSEDEIKKITARSLDRGRMFKAKIKFLSL